MPTSTCRVVDPSIVGGVTGSDGLPPFALCLTLMVYAFGSWHCSCQKWHLPPTSPSYTAELRSHSCSHLHADPTSLPSLQQPIYTRKHQLISVQGRSRKHTQVWMHGRPARTTQQGQSLFEGREQHDACPPGLPEEVSGIPGFLMSH